MSTHTPGPWTTRQVASTGHWWIRHLTDKSHHATTLHEADARLIAAAPDLLAACKQLVDLTRDYDPRAMLAGDDAIRMRWVEAWRAIREAIAKAEGVS